MKKKFIKKRMRRNNSYNDNGFRDYNINRYDRRILSYSPSAAGHRISASAKWELCCGIVNG